MDWPDWLRAAGACFEHSTTLPETDLESMVAAVVDAAAGTEDAVAEKRIRYR